MHCFAVDAVVRSGGLALFFNDDINIQLLSYCCGNIDTLCNINEMGNSCYVTGFYRNPSNLRPHLWILLQRLRTHRTLPLICFGDFNEILYAWEKDGGNDRCLEQMIDLQ